MIQNMTEILKKAKQESYAIAAYNVNNLEFAKFILEANEEDNAPTIIEITEPAIKYMGGYNVAVNMIKALIKDLNITVPIAIHLDHGTSVESCIKAIDAGFTSVMIDGSKYELNENIKMTKEVVDYAHSKGVSVEAEIGQVGGTEDDMETFSKYADPNEAYKLVKETKIDFLAPALGSVHGLYKGEPNIDFETTKKISEITELPLVLHGGTGIFDDMLLEGIKSGICKVNINTEMQVIWTNCVRKFLNDNPKVYDPRHINKAAEQAIKKAVFTKNKLLGSSNKA